MAVVKSWKVTSRPGPGEPNVSIVARESGLFSFVLSLLGIDATQTLQVSSRHVFHGTASLAGFTRTFVPLQHVATTSYGRFKPWKSTVIFIGLSVWLGTSVGGFSGGVLLLLGTALSLLYYFLKRNVTICVTVVNRLTLPLTFTRSLIEGQEIDEKAAEGVIRMIEHLIKPTEGVALEELDLSSTNSGTPIAAAAPQSLAELGRNLGIVKAASTAGASTTRAAADKCPKCGAGVTLDDAFCGVCGHKLK